jgi:hypothetical protein
MCSSYGLFLGIYTFYSNGSIETSSKEELKKEYFVSPTNVHSKIALESNNYWQKCA